MSQRTALPLGFAFLIHERSESVHLVIDGPQDRMLKEELSITDLLYLGFHFCKGDTPPIQPTEGAQQAPTGSVHAGIGSCGPEAPQHFGLSSACSTDGT